MTKKEHTTITELFQVLDLLESLDMQFLVGWRLGSGCLVRTANPLA